MKIKDKVLIVEDEQSISNFISMILTANGYDTIVVRSGEEALTMISSHCPDLIILDLGLPDMDGIEVLKSVRKWSSLPVVVVSARHHEHDKVEALDYGADDYISKPFNVLELKARIRAILRRSASRNTKSENETRVDGGAIVLELSERLAYVGERPVDLTPKEFDLLELLMRSPNCVFSRESLLNTVWGYDYVGETNTVDVYIRFLRSKLDEVFGIHLIETVRGVGYVIRGD